jgi:hypothetical protein
MACCSRFKTSKISITPLGSGLSISFPLIPPDGPFKVLKIGSAKENCKRKYFNIVRRKKLLYFFLAEKKNRLLSKILGGGLHKHQLEHPLETRYLFA